jgi:cytidine deaminase
MANNPPDNSNELFIALVAAVGIDLDLLVDQIGTQLSEYDYTSHNFRLSEYLAEHADSDFRELPFDERVWQAMTAGDELRQNWQRSDALALQAISDIVATREQEAGGSNDQEEGEEEPPNLDRHAFVIRSLKTPDELETLRSVYGPRLVVIAAYSPRSVRLKSLAEQIQDSRQSAAQETWIHTPEELIARDEKEQETRGQDVSGTFHRADFFVRAWDREVIEADLKRAFEVLFGDPFRTPNVDEYCQFLAAGAALRSAEFGRQVGAAIATKDGSIISLGTNEVPKPKGGSYWDGTAAGNREFEVSEVDTNRKHFDELAERLAGAVDQKLEVSLSEQEPEIPEGSSSSVRQTVRQALPEVLRQAGLKDLTEFGRAVHAEMNALLDAARRGISVQNATLYTTTFPCHNCARHIIGAGIKRVVFIEPYGKSRAPQLHGDAVLVEGSADEGQDERVKFVPFVGVAPRRYLEMFDAAARERLGHCGRQDEEGHKQSLDRKMAVPVFADSGLWQFRPELREYRAKELLALEHFNEHAEEK